MNTQEKLNRYYELDLRAKTMHAEMVQAIDDTTPQEVKDATAAIEQEYGDKIDVIVTELHELTEAIKAETIEAGETIKADYMMAVYNKGRASWDSKGLDGFSVAYPDILKFKKIGAPSVSLRQVK